MDYHTWFECSYFQVHFRILPLFVCLFVCLFATKKLWNCWTTGFRPGFIINIGLALRHLETRITIVLLLWFCQQGFAFLFKTISLPAQSCLELFAKLGYISIERLRFQKKGLLSFGWWRSVQASGCVERINIHSWKMYHSFHMHACTSRMFAYLHISQVICI